MENAVSTPTDQIFGISSQSGEKSWDFSPSDKQAFVVKFKSLDGKDWDASTAVIFENSPNIHKDRWEYAAGLSRLYDPLAVMALFYAQWNTVGPQLAQALGFPTEIKKVASLENLIKREVPYTRGDESTEHRNAFPIKLYGLRILKKSNQIEFFVGFLAGGEFENPIIRFTVPLMQKSLIKAQYQLRDRLEIIGNPEKLPPYINVTNYLRDSRGNLAHTFDAFKLSAIFKRKDKIPEFYKELWSFIADDLYVPDVIRIYILCALYEKILKNYLAGDEQSDLEGGFFSQAKADLSAQLNYQYPIVPDEMCSALCQAVAPKSYVDHALEHSKSAAGTFDAVKNAGGNALAMITHKKFTRDYVEELYQKLLKDQELTLPLLLLVRSLFHVLTVTQPDGNVEGTYLAKYMEDLDFALKSTEKQIDDLYRSRRYEPNRPASNQNCEISEEACKAMIGLKHSPYAWEQVFNQYKLAVALKNFTMGYNIPAVKGFVIKNITRALDKSHYEITYALGAKTEQHICIKNTPALENFLHAETKNSFTMPLAKRVNNAHVKIQEFLQEKQAVVLRLFSSTHDALWKSSPRIEAVYHGLKTRREDVKFTLTVNEKINLMVYSLIAVALEDKNLIGPVAEIFKLIIDEKQDCFIISGEDFLGILTRFNKPGLELHEACRRKAILCETLIEIHALGNEPARFKSYDELLEVFADSSVDDDEFSKDMETQIRLNQTAFIKEHLKDELKNYPSGDLVALYAIYFYLNTWETPPDQTLQLLQKIGIDLLKNAPSVSSKKEEQVEQQIIWAAGIFFQALSQCHLYQQGANQHQSLALMTLADSLLAEIDSYVKKHINQGILFNYTVLSQEKAAVASLLDKLESASLEKDIVPEFLNKKPEIIVPEIPPISQQEPKKKSKNKRTTIIMQDRETQTDFDEGGQLPPPQQNLLTNGLQAAAGVVTTFYTGVSSAAVNAINKTTNFMQVGESNPPADSLPDQLSGVPEVMKRTPIISESSNVLPTSNLPPADTLQVRTLPGNFQQENDDYYNNLKAKYQQPEVFSTYTKVTAAYQLAREKLTQLFATYKVTTTSLDSRLETFDTLARAALNEKSRIVGALAVPFDTLGEYYKSVSEKKHEERLATKKEVAELDASIKGISKLQLEKLLNDLRIATEKLNENYAQVESNLKKAKKQSEENQSNSKGASHAHLEKSAPEMISLLDQLEKQLSAECLVMHPKTCAKIYAYGQYQCTIDNGIQALIDKPNQYAQLLQASSHLRLSLSALSKSQPKVSTLNEQYQSLKRELDTKQEQVEKLSYFTSPIEKAKLKYSIGQLQDKISAYEKVEPATGVVKKYEEIPFWKFWQWKEKYRLYKSMNDTTSLLTTESKQAKVEMISDQSLQEEFETLQKSVPSNQTTQTDQTKQLIWTAQKLQEKGWREYNEELSEIQGDELIGQCDKDIDAFNKILKVCKSFTNTKIQAFITGYDNSKQWQNPLVEVERKACDDLFKDVPVPTLSALPTGKKSTNLYGGASSNQENFRSSIYNDSHNFTVPSNGSKHNNS